MFREGASWNFPNILPHLLSKYHTYVEGLLHILVVLVKLSLRLMLPHETRFSSVRCLLKSISFGEVVVYALSLKHSFCATKAKKNFSNIHTSIFSILATFCSTTCFGFFFSKLTKNWFRSYRDNVQSSFRVKGSTWST